MERKMSKKYPVTLLVLLSMIFTTGCSTQGNASKQVKKNNTIRVTYQLKSGDHSLDTKNVKLKKGAKIDTGLKKAWPTKERNGMVTEIDGHKQNDKKQKYWMYTINGKKAEKGVKQQKVNNKNKIIFTLQKVNE
ncbi:hypothetical protein FD11_GL001031 [Ligilactobacillus pobuzihii E100301 = KCTC 13174]|uniref:Transcobalamin-like C-terminal domain-containing protein n=2 Tax=Ligilactobacillus pobuzihii TaxID=449659 RepID=A0A0R2LDL2_9LACO|nr:hypothetical protein FD11_GL001031 [Ligilactobacillus pobuzihii E100301 = KCTC 13174]KRN99977.1 hypothetical protein IV66_GL001404 [Ligilactobacillus pobuzihii]